ncbi:MAG: gamma-glutamyltransferase family protein [Rhizobiales bacterium]|nr:gamma-glutamyltransferase family protein [Hyphomicrobiales bacterium]
MNETVSGRRGMVVAPHRAAAEAGAEVMRAGGNAIEAMLAAAATIAVTYPHMNSIGGDAFWLICEPGRAPVAIDAAGRAGSLATRERYARAGHEALPERGVLAALTVAGTVSGWAVASEIAAAMGGRMPRADLLADAIGRAKDGVPVARTLHAITAAHIDELRDQPNFAAHFLADGKAPAEGAILRQPRLADTLGQIAHAGYDDFYRGDVSVEIAADMEAAGGVVTREDLRRHEAKAVKPLSLAIRGATLFNLPPPTQGLASLILLGLFDRLGVTRGESFEHQHGLIESAKRAAAVRDREVTDPDHVGDIQRYLTPEWLAEEAATIDMRRATPPRPTKPGDTIWMGAIDGEGRAVSFIQSLYWEFGSGFVLPRTGIVWQNRGISFSLDPSARNPLTPGRKPFHTLNPPLARFADGRMMTYGSMGGDGQPQFQAQVFTRHALFGEEPGVAIDAPRFCLGATWGRRPSKLLLESRFDPDIVAALDRAGHEPTVSDQPYLNLMGHAGMIVRAPDGSLLGASDPRSDGAAVAV